MRRKLTLVRLLRFPLRLEVTHPQRKPEGRYQWRQDGK